MAEGNYPHGTIAHVAINSDDIERSQAFYHGLFGWTFQSWGPPGFFKIGTPAGPALIAALQERRELIAGVKTSGFECTVAVDDVPAAVAAALKFGGRVLMEPVTIPAVCELAFLEDPSGNIVGVAHYL